MPRKVFKRIAIVALITALVVVPVLAFFNSESGSEYAYEVPRMLGMEGIGGGEVASLNGPLSTSVSGPIFETHSKAVSLDKDLRDLPQTGPTDKKPAREMPSPPMGPNGNGIDSVLQGAVASAAPAPAPSSSFAGLDLTNWGAGWPPDTDGDVGPNHYIQAVNTSIGVFDKASGSRLAAFTFDAFFQANGGTDACATLNYGDPIVLYDQVSGRWIITDFAFAGASSPPYYECIAVSKTADPVSGGWWLYTVVASSDSLNDYPKLGIWGDGIYMSANMFKRGRTYAGAEVWALNRDDLISGAPLRSVAFTLGNSYFSLLPANARVDLPPAGTPEYFMSDYGSNTSMKLWQFHVDWNTPSASTLTGPTSFAVTAFTRPSSNSVPQKGSSELLDTLGDRLMTWLQYTNIGGTESLWVSRSVVSGSTDGVRWMEVRNMSSTPSVYQEGTYAPDSNYRWMPSLAVNGNGSMAVGYSVSSSNMYPAIRYAGRLSTDPLGVLGQTEASLIEGTGSQSTSGNYHRWGDYASMSVDPTDNCTFWFTTEYYATTGQDWQTRIGSFQLPDCGGGGGGPTDSAPTVSITNPSNGATVSGTVSVTASASDDNGVTQVEFFIDGNSIGVDTTAPYSVSWDTTAYSDGSHTLTATATDTIGQTGSDSVGVTVQNTVASGTMHVSAINMSYTQKGPNYTVSIQVSVVDATGAPVSGATVYLSVDDPGGTTATGSGTTGSNGTVTFTYRSKNTGTYVATVTNVTSSSYTYDPGSNVVSSASLQVP